MAEQLGYPVEQLRVLADFLCDERHGLAVSRKGGNPLEDRYLLYVRDPSSRWDSRLRSEVMGLGEDLDDLIGRTLTVTPQPSMDPEDPMGTPAAPWRFDPVSLDITTDVELTSNKFNIAAEAEILMTVEAVGGPVQVVYFNLYKNESGKKSWRLVELPRPSSGMKGWGGH